MDPHANQRSFTKSVLLAATLAVGFGTGCLKIDGGAVELSWLIVTPAGAAITDCGCADPAIAKVRLVLLGMGGAIDGTTPCAGEAQCDFPCRRQTGSTPFDVKPTDAGEMYQVSVEALGQGGGVLPDVVTPAPILRQVMNGQPTELPAFTLVAGCAAACD